jgi:hypothetical protein
MASQAWRGFECPTAVAAGCSAVISRRWPGPLDRYAVRPRATQGSGAFRSYPVLSGTHEGHCCQESVRTWPGDCARRRAGLTILLDPSSQLPASSRRAVGGQAGAPAAAQRRGRTRLTPASGALLALYDRQSSAFRAGWVLVSAIVLVCWIGVICLGRLTRTVYRATRIRDSETASGSTPAAARRLPGFRHSYAIVEAVERGLADDLAVEDQCSTQPAPH